MSSSVMPVVLAALLAAAPAAAQTNAGEHPQHASQVTAEQAIANAREVYGPPTPSPKKNCPPPKPGGEIVVCAQRQEQSQFRVKSSAELDPTGDGAKGDVPRAPDLAPHYPGAVAARGCFVPPCPPPMPKLIDLKAIPEAPPGSDADRVAHGLAPTGYEGQGRRPKSEAVAPSGGGDGKAEASQVKPSAENVTAKVKQPE